MNAEFVAVLFEAGVSFSIRPERRWLFFPTGKYKLTALYKGTKLTMVGSTRASCLASAIVSFGLLPRETNNK